MLNVVKKKSPLPPSSDLRGKEYKSATSETHTVGQVQGHVSVTTYGV